VSSDAVFNVKRLTDREFNDPSVQDSIKHFPCKVIDKNSKLIVQINTGRDQTSFAPDEISAIVLGKMREIAMSFFFIIFPPSLINYSFE
jgi:heat shock protein 5